MKPMKIPQMSMPIMEDPVAEEVKTLELYGVNVECFDGNYYVRIGEYERLLQELEELKKENGGVEDVGE